MAMVMEGLHGSESRVRYDIIGHSGEDPHISFVNRDMPPDNEKKRLDVLEVKRLGILSALCRLIEIWTQKSSAGRF